MRFQAPNLRQLAAGAPDGEAGMWKIVGGIALLVALGIARHFWKKIPVLQCPNCHRYLLEENIEIEVTGIGGRDREYATCPNCELQWLLEQPEGK